MSEKEKPKRSSRYGVLRLFLIFSFGFLLLGIACSSSVLHWVGGDYVTETSLDPAFLPTAEYLLEHPIETGDFSLRVSYNDWLSEPAIGSICFALQVSTTRRELLHNIQWSDIYIDESIVGHFYDGHNYIENDSTIFRSICVMSMSRPYLDSGLHIIEFRAKESLFAEPYYIHRWAVEIP